jgi:hypothetical protein
MTRTLALGLILTLTDSSMSSMWWWWWCRNIEQFSAVVHAIITLHRFGLDMNHHFYGYSQDLALQPQTTLSLPPPPTTTTTTTTTSSAPTPLLPPTPIITVSGDHQVDTQCSSNTPPICEPFAFMPPSTQAPTPITRLKLTDDVMARVSSSTHESLLPDAQRIEFCHLYALDVALPFVEQVNKFTYEIQILLKLSYHLAWMAKIANLLTDLVIVGIQVWNRSVMRCFATHNLSPTAHCLILEALSTTIQPGGTCCQPTSCWCAPNPSGMCGYSELLPIGSLNSCCATTSNCLWDIGTPHGQANYRPPAS